MSIKGGAPRRRRGLGVILARGRALVAVSAGYTGPILAADSLAGWTMISQAGQ